MALIDKLQNIGDAVRTKTGHIGGLTLDEMAQKIRDYEGKIPVIEPLTVSENGTFTPAVGVDGFGPVNVEVPEAVLRDLVTNKNGIYDPPEGVDGFKQVTVNVVFDGGLPSSEEVKW